ncbi:MULTISPECIES: efflux RND transporter periplasmic adaptor subunit [Marinomonas]|jgi:RND family efflux transporter, MFP subunit|uniref:Efflux transporter, RND family, MFP subunit n=2 Tax=Marinomonas TaxID=28253 RepID=F2JTN8_MARM1|nr:MULTISPECIES: efflux RND transporter periplasmic adaptor subunit [Marinomonas]ADZ92658.1 efflux transporter, RND family, MFP subunit [Marinomonas mediterranea MMB-1]TDO98004.1 RND family efflux transporter MFP subunit [Marinomonas balearica]WCN10595.1 efflux RND transporter periplasmic adaptor subunit [Marinomonas mediterranea]WCN14646.1 efflux RND transporter periplasmic adaptor subunit [Marinomonas mediterranea]WCN18691.1 efflux RND transporter periplasmic adaptor subunit [Marinomonas med
MNRFLRKTNLVGAAIIAASLISACSPEETQVVAEEVIRPVKLINVASTEAENVRRFPGELQASEEAYLAFRVGGQLSSLNVVSGQRVKKGDLLATLDPTDFKLQVELSEANNRLAKSQFGRIKTMLKQNATTKSQYDEAKANLDQTSNALKSSRNQLGYTKLYAPFDGVIASVDVENFQYVNATQTLMHIQNIDTMDVLFQVPEHIVVNIQNPTTEMIPNVYIDASPDFEYHGIYKEHETTSNKQTKAYDVTLELLESDGDSLFLLPGMTANVDIDVGKLLGKKVHITVPVEAVMRKEDTQSNTSYSIVWIYDESTQSVSSRQVELGELQDDKIEILTGLNPNDKVVAAGIHSLTENMKVRPWTRERGI